MPAAVKAIAVDKKYSNKVAIGREDGDIEVSYMQLQSILQRHSY